MDKEYMDEELANDEAQYLKEDWKELMVLVVDKNKPIFTNI